LSFLKLPKKMRLKLISRWDPTKKQHMKPILYLAVGSGTNGEKQIMLYSTSIMMISFKNSKFLRSGVCRA